MAYYDVALLSHDNDFAQRTIACYAIEHGPENPEQWWGEHSWEMAAMPTFGDAYAYALETGVENPGKNPGVITDNQILAAVQSIMNAS